MKKRHFAYTLTEDSDCESPRDEDYYNLGTLCCWDRNCNVVDEQIDNPLGESGYDSKRDDVRWYIYNTFIQDEEDISPQEGAMPAILAKHIDEWVEENLCIEYVSMYEHSGVSLSLGANSGWDTRTVGYIYVTKEDYEKAMEKPFTQEGASAILESEIETYSNWLNGEVYLLSLYEVGNSEGLTIKHDNALFSLYEAEEATSFHADPVDQCGGYIGKEWAEEAAKSEFKDVAMYQCMGPNPKVKTKKRIHNSVVWEDFYTTVEMTRKELLTYVETVEIKNIEVIK